MRIVFAVLLMVGGCAKEDLCGGAEAAGLTCLTTHVTGSVDTDALIDRLQVDVTYNDKRVDSSVFGSQDVTQRFIVKPETDDGGVGATLPLVFPIVFNNVNAQPAYGSRMIVVAYQGNTPIGYGVNPTKSYDSLFEGMSGAHIHVGVALQPVHKDGKLHPCFDPQDMRTISSKTGPTCGGVCPACPLGESCSSHTDCASPYYECSYQDDPKTNTYHSYCHLP